MLLKYFNSNRISVIILVSLLPVVYWIPSLFQGIPIPATETSGVPFGRMIISFSHGFSVISSILALLLVVVNGYLLIQLNTIHIFIPVRTLLPSFFYAILVISITQLHRLTPALVASTLMILVYYRIFSAYKTDRIAIAFLDAGLLISVASLIYFPTLLFFLYLLVCMVLLRPFIWREWAFVLLGLLLPYLFLISVYYLSDIPVASAFTDIADSFIKVSYHLKLSHIVYWSYVALFMLISSYFIAKAIDNMKIHARKFFLVFLAFFLFSILIFFVLPGAGMEMVFFVSVPLAYIFSHYFIKCQRNWVNELFLFLFLLLFFWQRIN